VGCRRRRLRTTDLDDYILLLVHSGNVVGSGTLVDEREIKGGFLRQIKDLLVLNHRLRLQRLLVVVQRRGEQAQLVHRLTQVVVTLL